MEALPLLVPLLLAQLMERWGDRRRIRNHIGNIGGRVLTISPRFAWRSRADWMSRVYEVRSYDINGQERCTLYRTGFWLGTWKYSPLDELRSRAAVGRSHD